MEADNIKLILEKKIATQKPSYEEISQANMKVKSLHYYKNSLDIKYNALTENGLTIKKSPYISTGRTRYFA